MKDFINGTKEAFNYFWACWAQSLVKTSQKWVENNKTASVFHSDILSGIGNLHNILM